MSAGKKGDLVLVGVVPAQSPPHSPAYDADLDRLRPPLSPKSRGTGEDDPSFLSDVPFSPAPVPFSPLSPTPTTKTNERRVSKQSELASYLESDDTRRTSTLSFAPETVDYNAESRRGSTNVSR